MPIKKNICPTDGNFDWIGSIVTKIIAEEYLENDSSNLYDHKVRSFNRKRMYIIILVVVHHIPLK